MSKELDITHDKRNKHTCHNSLETEDDYWAYMLCFACHIEEAEEEDAKNE